MGTTGESGMGGAMVDGAGEAAVQLATLADQARRQPAPPEDGRFSYVRTRGRYNASRHGVRADGSLRLIDRRIEDAEREFWIAPNGAGRIEETRSGRRTDTSGTYGPGELHPLETLPTERALLEQVLARTHPARSTCDWFRLFGRTWHERFVSPHLQAALLLVLADKPDLTWHCPVLDPISRPGAAVSTGTTRRGRPRSKTLYFDLSTGMLLTSATTYPTSHTRLSDDASRPADSYTAWLHSGSVADTETRPRTSHS